MSSGVYQKLRSSQCRQPKETHSTPKRHEYELSTSLDRGQHARKVFYLGEMLTFEWLMKSARYFDRSLGVIRSKVDRNIALRVFPWDVMWTNKAIPRMLAWSPENIPNPTISTSLTILISKSLIIPGIMRIGDDIWAIKWVDASCVSMSFRFHEIYVADSFDSTHSQLWKPLLDPLIMAQIRRRIVQARLTISLLWRFPRHPRIMGRFPSLIRSRCDSSRMRMSNGVRDGIISWRACPTPIFNGSPSWTRWWLSCFSLVSSLLCT